MLNLRLETALLRQTTYLGYALKMGAEIGYYDNSDGYVKRVEVVAPTKYVEIILS